MDEHKSTIITKETAISISMLIVVCGAVWFMSDLNSRVKQQESRIEVLETTITDVATMKSDISVIKTNINWIISTLGGAEITQ